MNVKNQFDAGATVIFAIHPVNFTRETIIKLVKSAIPHGYSNEKVNALLERRINVILSEDITAIDHTPDVRNSIGSIHLTVDSFKSKGDESIRYDKTKKYLGFVSHPPTLPLENKDKINRYLSLMRNAFDCLEPEFGWGCLYDDLYDGLEGDARRTVWGINYYGKELVDKIGKGKLLSQRGIFNVEERPWGGVILQLTENPFVAVPAQLKEKIVKDLKIDEVMA